MSIWKKLTGEFIDIIEWMDPTPNTLVYRFPHHDNEIKYGAKLVVREGQHAVFVNMGEIADVFEPGTVTLETPNIPILSKLQNWKHGFESPFKAEVYFVNTRQFTDQKWGTRNPIMLRDAEFGPVRLRAFGTYAFRVQDAGRFLKELVGTDRHFTTEEITDQLRNLLVSRFSDLIGEMKIPALDLAANYDEFGTIVSDKVRSEFNGYGIELTSVLIENISLPEEVEKILDKRTSMGVLGDLSQYTKFQAAQAIEEAAKNPGGGASEGIGMGMGFAMANQMAQQMQGKESPGVPPPLPAQANWAFHIEEEGKPVGPYGPAEIQTRIAAGTLTGDTLVWKKGMPDWAKASLVPELAPLFGDAPPPLPA